MKLNVFAVAWYQLSHQRMKLVAAVAGVVVAVMLMLVQLGIRRGAMDNSISFARRITSPLVVVSPRTKTIFQSAQFPRRLLDRLLAIDGVEHVESIFISQARWRNPWEHFEHPISVYGLDPDQRLLNMPGLDQFEEQLRISDQAIFDAMSRTNYGPVAKTLDSGQTLAVEINGRRVDVVGSTKVGISIGNDGNIYVSHSNFQRLFPGRIRGSIDLGLVQVRDDVDIEEVIRKIEHYLGGEAKVVRQPDLVAAEIQYMRSNAPVDFIFGMGTAVGFFIGFVVVYQILYTEVTNHLPQLATLKAVGFTDGYLFKLVLSQAAILSTLGYIPGFLMALALYQLATQQIQMPFHMTWSRALGVFAATQIMCILSAIIAVRKAWTADPAEVF